MKKYTLCLGIGAGLFAGASYALTLPLLFRADPEYAVLTSLTLGGLLAAIAFWAVAEMRGWR